MHDLISRQAAINTCFDGWNKGYKEIADDIKALPAADVAPYTLEKDGTLTITVPKDAQVGRVLVQEDGTQWGGLYYAD